MKQIRTLLVAACALVALSAVHAAPVSPKRAHTVAQNFSAALQNAKGGMSLREPNVSWPFSGIYLFEGENGGFVLVAADDCLRPILGYSTSGSLNPNNMPPALSQWLQGYQQVATAVASTKGMVSAYTNEWRTLEDGFAPKDSVGTVVGPLLTSTWDQMFPYNLLCPTGATATGCAATAQAQLMNYWHHPAFGQGQHCYVHSRYGLQTADFGHTLYDWEHMPTMATLSSPDSEKVAVATLMYHCGVSLDMNYGTAAQGGSSAIGLVGMDGYASIDNSLKDYFRYAPTFRVEYKSGDRTNAQWRDLLIAELDLLHPIIYTGQSSEGGHGFVCDGYDQRGYLHFNFGWSGVGDGYYPVDSICPGTGGVGGNVTYTFNDDNSALIGLVPDYRMAVSDTAIFVSRDGGADSLLFAVNDTLHAPWSVESSADWLSVAQEDFTRAGWVRFSAQANATGAPRQASLIFHQGQEQLAVTVMQNAFSEEEMCPLVVLMESTHGSGWQGGAHLTLESATGFVYGTAQLVDAVLDSVEIAVAPNDVYAVWHSGGGTDRYINYSVRNQYGEEFVNVRYAYRNGGTHHIDWPCAHLDIDAPSKELSVEKITLSPNPAYHTLTIQADGFERVELMDMRGRVIGSSQSPQLDVSNLPKGAYFAKIVTSRTSVVKRFVKK